MIRYSHTQRNLYISVLASAAGITAAVVLALEGKFWPALLVPLIIIPIGFVFSTLSVEVTDAHLRFWFGPGFPRKTILLGTFRSARPTRTSWVWGWGIHLTPRGWLYNIAGLDAVEITAATGRQMLLGTDEPQKLADALNRAIAGRTAS